MLLPKIRETYIELVDFLKEIMFQKDLLERPTYMELSKKLGYTYNWIKDKKDAIKTHYPQKRTFDDFYTRLSKRYKVLLIGSWNTIEKEFQKLYNITFPTETNLPSSPSGIKESIKREFFDDIKEIIKSHFPNARVFDTDLSRIFFRRARALKDSHLKGNCKFRKLEISTLFSMIFKIRFLTKQDLIKKVRDIKKVEQQTLNKIKRDIETNIIDFIFSKPFNQKYISDKHEEGTIYFKPEFDLSFNIWFEISKIKNKPLLLKPLRRLIGYDSFGRFTKGYIYSWDGIMNMLKSIISLVPSENYIKIFEKSWQYIEIRGLSPVVPRNYNPSWDLESTIKFHVLMLLIRDLGLDILTLESIPSKSFKRFHGMTSTTFERHHIYKNDKYSLDVNRLVLVIHKNHYKLEGQTDVVIDLIKSRIDLTLECPHYYKSCIKKWKQKWQEYLERRSYLIENGIENFIANYFTDEQGNNYILDRFFKNVPKGRIEQEIRNIMLDWINKGRPAPILNTYILNRLFLGTPYLLNSGYIGNYI